MKVLVVTFCLVFYGTSGSYLIHGLVNLLKKKELTLQHTLLAPSCFIVLDNNESPILIKDMLEGTTFYVGVCGFFLEIVTPILKALLTSHNNHLLTCLPVILKLLSWTGAI